MPTVLIAKLQFRIIWTSHNIASLKIHWLFWFVVTLKSIASYASNTSLAGESLRQCLDTAVQSIPNYQLSSTPIILGATAAMRMLRSEMIMTSPIYEFHFCLHFYYWLSFSEALSHTRSLRELERLSPKRWGTHGNFEQTVIAKTVL